MHVLHANVGIQLKLPYILGGCRNVKAKRCNWKTGGIDVFLKKVSASGYPVLHYYSIINLRMRKKKLVAGVIYEKLRAARPSRRRGSKGERE